jgi:hypothetical protein
MKKLILTLTALSGLAIGALAASGPPVMIPQLPFTIDVPGDYILDPSAVANPVYSASDGVIQITASNVNLNLNDLTIECTGQGIVVGDNPDNPKGIRVDHVSIKNGTVDETVQQTSRGLVIGAGSDHVSVAEVAFTGGFGYNADYGAYTSLKNCTFQALLNIYSQGNFAPGVTPGHSTYQNLTVAMSWFPAWTGTALSSVGPDSAPFNDFKNITVLSGNVQLNSGDTYQHFFTTGTTQILGGTNVQPGNQAKNSK